SAMAWWLEAGVDVAVQEEARDWLKPAAPARPTIVEAAPNVAEPSADTLADLQSWLASSATLPLARTAARRILPHGPEQAAGMLLSDRPTLEDAASGQPIRGESWALTRRMRAASGMSADEAYSASLARFQPPGARTGEADRQECAETARRPVRPVRPKGRS